MPLTRRDFVRTLFAASQTALVGGLMADAALAKDAAPGALNFAIIGDWGRYGRPDQAAVAKQMGLACAEAKASFVISVGDNFYEDGVASLQDPHWTHSFENVYAAPSLQVPWSVILGNHDYRGSCDVQLDYGKTHPRWLMPARYYRQVHPVDASTKLECFYIDTSPMMSEYKDDVPMRAIHTQNVPQQLAWLDAALAESTAPWKLVIGHHPIYSAGLGHGSELDLITNLLPMLQKHGVQAYICGHDHDLQHLRSNDLHFLISGGGSEHRPVLPIPETQFARPASGFALASVRAHEMQVRFIDDQGRVLHTAEIARGA
ncbi:MAG: tartrate-resistant acid phosphatase type 5 family protein, partial [Verrucomicrobiota bacterium]